MSRQPVPPPQASRPGRARRGRRVSRTLWPVLATLALVLVLFTAVFPTRTFLAQRAATSAAEERLEALSEQNEVLEARARQLQDDEEIERLAREQYNLVMPGEEAYALLPAPVPPTTPPVPEDAPDDRNVVERAWDSIAGLF